MWNDSYWLKRVNENLKKENETLRAELIGARETIEVLRKMLAKKIMDEEIRDGEEREQAILSAGFGD